MLSALSYALNRKWDVLSGAKKMAWDVLSGQQKWHGMFCPGCQKLHGMFCPGGKSMSFVLSGVSKKDDRMFCPGMFCPTFHYFVYHVLLCMEGEFGFLVRLVVLS